MKEIIIKNKNGITLKTAGTLVQEDIKLTLDSSLSPSYENGDDLIWGGVVGYTVVINAVIARGQGTLGYSTDGGLSWYNILDEGQTTLTGVTQIKFRIDDVLGASSAPLVSSTLGLMFMTNENSGETQNFILTQDVLDVNWGE